MDLVGLSSGNGLERAATRDLRDLTDSENRGATATSLPNPVAGNAQMIVTTAATGLPGLTDNANRGDTTIG